MTNDVLDKSEMTKDELYRLDKFNVLIVMAYSNQYGDRQRDSLLALKVYAERGCYDVGPELEVYYKRGLVDKVVSAIDDHGSVVDNTAHDAIRELSERVAFEDWFLKNREWYLGWCASTHREP